MDAFNALMPGSSPLTRGKLAARQQRVPQAGFIPAHAGKTQLPQPRSRVSWAHPRSRGENAVLRSLHRTVNGASPLTRGKRGAPSSFTPALRLIPAHAGKTALSLATRNALRAHPRSRGENTTASSATFSAQGSSPLTRGKRARRPRRLVHRRLIPAHAGKTPPQRTASRSTAAHPRSRGENGSASLWMYGGAGSSPLTRGKLACA